MDELGLLEKIRECFKEAFGTDPSIVAADSTPEDIAGWDSLGHAALTMAIEKKFNLAFDIDELMEMEDVESIIRVMTAKLS